MKITIWSLKGGVGKTSIALNLALTFNNKIITNEIYSLLPAILKEDRLLQLNPRDNLPKLDKSENVIFDLGGTIDKRIVDCVKQSDFVLIPTTSNDIDIQGCIGSINELNDYVESKKIVIIVNKTKSKQDFAKVTRILKNLGEFKYKEIKQSKALINIFVKKKSIRSLVEEGGLNKYNYAKVNEQFENLINCLRIRR